ncbi:endonuclease IV [Halanaerobium saccharolyticum]|uniref:Probable endonuclease 4 n=1 Tax=Halanaerobium saccharolyticum TaxID=43595 RepID=A0A4V3G5W0_9FIRM|nr:deoxyribonuclease IV [Halanaerobium saccharolyticum]RAK11137.1 endonuclease IV [Halanaerobium saccharolyticum]TDW06988.1 endonuclease IV [Halanaerobium saccharolyticum]TDX63753.1 endonuclease IV [Halanaerobium saccharolyticum]
MILGKHVSIAGGLDQAFKRAADIGCNSMQIFVKNPRGWKMREVEAEEVEKFKVERNKYKINPVVVHAAYLINLASPKIELWEKSISALKSEYERCDRLGAEYLIFHPGSHTGSGLERGIQKIAKALNQILAEVETETMILLENTAGAGTSIGEEFTQLKAIIDLVDQSSRLGVCVDSCHAFTAQYNLAEPEGLEELITDFDQVIGLKHLKVIHLNDSKYDCCTNKDEHAHIGEGKIGSEAFKRLINHSKLEDKIFILETPWFDNQEKDDDVILLKELRED